VPDASIREVAVIGIPDPLWGEAAKAHVVLREGATSDAETVIRFCKGSCALTWCRKPSISPATFQDGVRQGQERDLS